MKHNWQIILLDILLVALSTIFGLMLRLEIIYVGYFVRAIWPFFFLAIIVRPLILYAFGIYRRMWQYATTRDFVVLGLSIIAGTIILTLITMLWLYPRLMSTFPRSLLIIEGILSLLFLGGVRVGFKIIEQYREETEKSRTNFGSAERALIVGAGSAGNLTVQELRANPQLGVKPVAFLDDDPKKIGRRLQGLTIFGPQEKIEEVVADRNVEVVVIAMPSAPGEVVRKILESCEGIGVPTKIIPGLYEILSGRVSISRLQPVKVSDLLRRDAVYINTAQVRKALEGKRILVTGAGGSIGSELCSQILTYQPSQLVALGHGENSLYALHTYLSAMGYKNGNIVTLLADIRDRSRLEVIFSRFQPEIVFHAAAHKHVPLMEENVEDAITNNIMGTMNLVQLSKANKVGHFVLISTDKAVEPVNVMGMTKRVAELIVRMAAAETGRPYVSVRFGNVLGSRGSVIPVFQRQIAMGGPVTVTHPEMVRFFMTIPEAVQLVLQASALGRNGEVFVLDMGEPVRITDLARDMIELSGYEVDRDIKIVYTGLRPGERLFELLFSAQEDYTQTEHEKIFVTRDNAVPHQDMFERELETLFELARSGKAGEIRAKLDQLASVHDGSGEVPVQPAENQSLKSRI